MTRAKATRWYRQRARFRGRDETDPCSGLLAFLREEGQEGLGRVRLRRGVAVHGGGDRRAREEEFEIVGRVGEVRVLLRDRLALLGHAEFTAHRAVRQRGHEPMGRTRTARDRAAAAVEEAQLDAALVAGLREIFLRPVRCSR